MKYTAIVVEDEYKVRKVFLNLLQHYCKNIEIIGVAENIKDAYELITKKNPQIVFLDIEMPNGNGFDLLAYFEKPPFEVVFVTSYGHYAIQAIKVSALDYLLKPVMVSDLLEMVKKIEERISDKFDKLQYKILLENIKGSDYQKKLVVNTKTRTEYILFSKIIYLQADRNYTTIQLENESICVAKTLKDYEDMLCSSGSSFMRIHKGYIVNLNFILTVNGCDSLTIRLKNGCTLEVSRRKKQELIEKLAKQQSNASP